MMGVRRRVLHFVTPLKNVSPFDVNMAVDAGFDLVVPYSSVELGEIAGLVQDAIFSRAPHDGRHTAVLIGGREPMLALDMLDAAARAMVPPQFEISLMADPSGAFTTAAALIAVAERHLQARGAELAGREVVVFGATGPVGQIAGLIAAQAGATVTLAGYDGVQRVGAIARAFAQRQGVTLAAADGSGDTHKQALLARAQVVIAAGRAGTPILTAAQLATAPDLEMALDVNAVPPAGIEGIGAFDDGKALAGTKGIGVGALAVGNVKFKTEHDLLAAMSDAEPRRRIGIAEAFAKAREHARA